MSNLFNGAVLNNTPSPIIPGNQIVIPPITIPPGFTAQPMMAQTVNQMSAKGKDAAKKIPLGPNSRVAIFDESNELFYFRETDSNGADISFKTCRYEEVEDPPEPQYLTVQEFHSSLDSFAKKLKEELLDGQSVRT